MVSDLENQSKRIAQHIGVEWDPACLEFYRERKAVKAASLFAKTGIFDITLSFIKDELTIQTYNFYSNAIGGVKLQVTENDYERAYKILKELGYIKKPEQSNSVIVPKIFDVISKKIPGKYVYALVLIGIILPSAYLIYLSPYHHVGDKAPELMIIDQPGVSGYPNLAVMFYTQKATTEFINYGTSMSDMDTQVLDSNPIHSHVFVLKDLNPGTQYFYQINGEGKNYSEN